VRFVPTFEGFFYYKYIDLVLDETLREREVAENKGFETNNKLGF